MTYEADVVELTLLRRRVRELEERLAARDPAAGELPTAEQIEAKYIAQRPHLVVEPAPPVRLVAAGRRGPAFVAKEEAVIGPGGLRSGRYEASVPRRDLIDIDAKHDSTPKGCERRTDEEWAAATDEWSKR